MMDKRPIVILFLLLVCVPCFGQSSFKGLTPGKSTRADVARVLGQPLREVSETLSEYKTENEAEKIFVQYRSETTVVERIEAIYPRARDRAGVIQALRLPALPTASQTNSKGRLEEYFAPANIVLTYASGEADNGISRIGYYSRDLFESAVANVPRNPQTGRVAADKPATKNQEAIGPAPRAGRSDSSIGTTTQTERVTTTVITATPPDNLGPKRSIRRIPDETKDDSAGVAAPDSESSNNGLVFSAAMLDQLVGSYEFFDAPDDPLLNNVVVNRVDGKLRWNAGEAKYLLIPTGTGQISDADGRVEKHILQFKLEGKPGVKVQFMVKGGRVDQVTYLAVQAGTMLFVLGKPKR
jgi:hypothetical protein